MAHGAIRALGNSISLKAKYGAGYRINLMVNPGESAKVKDLVINRVPGVFLEDESAESLIFQFPTTSQKHIPEFVQFLEEDGKKVEKIESREDHSVL